MKELYTEVKDFEEMPQQGGGNYISLKQKGDKVRIRVVSSFFHYKVQVPDQQTKENKLIDKFTCLVIDRKDDEIKYFEAPATIYSKLWYLRHETEWGNCRNFDVDVERTEGAGADYYRVTPVPNTPKDLTDAEAQKLIASTLNLAEYVKERAYQDKSNETKSFPDDKPVEPTQQPLQPVS